MIGRTPYFKHPCTWAVLELSEQIALDLDSELRGVNQYSRHEFVGTLAIAVEHARIRSELMLRKGHTVIADLSDNQDSVLNTDRFKQHSVIITVVDEFESHCVDVLRDAARLSLEQILVCKESDLRTVRLAFNEGLISGFVDATEEGWLSEVVSRSERVTNDYLAMQLPLAAIETSWWVESVLRSSEFKDFCGRHKILEYYYCELPVGILCLNNIGRAWFYGFGSKFNLDLQKPTNSLLERGKIHSISNSRLDEEIWYWVDESPPLSIDYDANLHSYHGYSKGQLPH